jgi:hypothetical protein
VEKIVINKNIWDLLFRLKTKMDFKVILIVLYGKMVGEEKITSSLRISMKTLQKSLKRLIDLGLVKRMRHKTDHNVRIIIDNRFYPSSECQDCKYSEISKFIICKLKGPDCLHDHERLSYGLWKLIKDEYEEINVLENLRGNIGKGGQTKENINDWGYKDFALFYIEQFKTHFPSAVEQTEMLSLRLNVKKLMKIVREKTHESKWRYIVKHFISKRMNECAESKVLINPTMLLDPASLRKFLEGKGYKIMTLDYCKQCDIFCSYMKNDECQLEKSNAKCDDELVERMKERYN